MHRVPFFPIASVTLILAFVLLDVAADDRSPSTKIDELHSEKISILDDIVARYEFGYSKGKPVLEELLAAKHDSLRAKLAVAGTQADHLKLLELIVENRRELFEARVAAHQLGNIAEVEILTARVAFIDAQIALTSEMPLGSEKRQEPDKQ